MSAKMMRACGKTRSTSLHIRCTLCAAIVTRCVAGSSVLSSRESAIAAESSGSFSSETSTLTRPSPLSPPLSSSAPIA